MCIRDSSVTWYVSDGCGNTTVCTHDFEVFDAKKPTPVCLSLSTVIMPSSGEVTIWATDFESGSSFDNCTPFSGLQFSFSSDVTQTSMALTCAMTANSTTVPVEIWVTDAAGNQDFCVTFINVQDPNGACDPGTTSGLPQPQGAIQTEEGLDVELVNVDLMGSNEPTITTGANGQFDFGQMPASTAQYVISPEKNINPTNGVTTFDLVLISQHILGTNPIASPYKIIAADANASETITTFDIVVLRRLILQIDTQFPGAQTSWRFVDAAHTFASTANADVFPFPETIVADANGGDNFVGVKIGDLNGSATVNQLLGTTDTRSFDGNLVFQLEDKQVQAGEEFTVDFRANDFNNTLGYQLSLIHISEPTRPY